MSWQAYIDTSLVATGHVAYGAIYGLDGSLWTCSPELANVPADAIQAMVNAFSDSGLAALRTSGCWLGPKSEDGANKYMVLRGDERSVYIKKGQGGGALVKTNQCVILGVYKEGQVTGQCNSAVEKLADYLIESGY
jgi:profilin